MISDPNAGFYGLYGADNVHKKEEDFFFFYETDSTDNKCSKKQ